MNRETGNVLLGFLVGAVAGGVAALLFAPPRERAHPALPGDEGEIALYAGLL